jgi:predicted small secreted protein
MKKNKRLSIGFLGVIAVAAIMGFSLTACPNTDNTGDKTSYSSLS